MNLFCRACSYCHGSVREVKQQATLKQKKIHTPILWKEQPQAAGTSQRVSQMLPAKPEGFSFQSGSVWTVRQSEIYRLQVVGRCYWAWPYSQTQHRNLRSWLWWSAAEAGCPFLRDAVKYDPLKPDKMAFGRAEITVDTDIRL